MTLAGFVLANLLRNKRRTVLTVLSLGASVFLVATLEGSLHYLDHVPRALGGERRLFVHGRASLRDRMPESYVEQVRTTPGVEAASALMWYGGIYREFKPENLFAQFGCDPDEIRKVMPELEPVDPRTGEKSPDLYAEFAKDQAGGFAGRDLFEKFGWKLGDVITLRSFLYPVELEFTLRAAFHAESGGDNRAFYFHRKYLDEALGRPGFVNAISVLTTSVEEVSPVIDRIDARFANSSAETLTESETVLRASFLKMLGNIRFLVGAITSAVGFTMLMVAANSVSIAARERAGEIAVLKTLGFTVRRVLSLMLSEAALTGLAGALLGILLAYALAPVLRAITQHLVLGRLLADYELAAVIPAILLPVGVAIGIAAALVPCWSVARLPIAATIRRS